MLKRKEREKLILKSAGKVFSRKGFYLASISDIIKEAQIARGTFYLYFESKQSIFDRLLNDFFNSISEVIKIIKISPDEESPIEQIKENIIRVLNIIVQEKSLARLLFNHPKELDANADFFYRNIYNLINIAVEIGIKMKIIRSSLSSQIIIPFLIGGIKELISYNLSKKMDVNKIADQILKFISKGLFLD